MQVKQVMFLAGFTVTACAIPYYFGKLVMQVCAADDLQQSAAI